MIYDLKNEYQIPKFKEYVNKLFKERAVVEVKKKLPNRTLAQNSYLHLLWVRCHIPDFCFSCFYHN